MLPPDGNPPIPPDPEKGFLEDVLGGGRVHQKTSGEVVERSRVSLVEDAERAVISRPEAGHELFIGPFAAPKAHSTFGSTLRAIQRTPHNTGGRSCQTT